MKKVALLFLALALMAGTPTPKASWYKADYLGHGLPLQGTARLDSFDNKVEGIYILRDGVFTTTLDDGSLTLVHLSGSCYQDKGLHVAMTLVTASNQYYSLADTHDMNFALSVTLPAEDFVINVRGEEKYNQVYCNLLIEQVR